MSRPAAWWRRAAYREWGTLPAELREALAGDRWRAVPLALGSAAAVGLLQAVQHTRWGAGVVERIGVVSASLVWWVALLRTPLSLFVPAVDLPVWGALAQVLVVFGIAEITLGRARTLAVAYTATLAGTLFARWALASAAHPLPGVRPVDAYARDTGPSAAVIALAVCVAWRHRARWTGAVVLSAVALEAVRWPNLAGWEHLVAVAAALGCCVADEVVRRYRARRPVARCPHGGG